MRSRQFLAKTAGFEVALLGIEESSRIRCLCPAENRPQSRRPGPSLKQTRERRYFDRLLRIELDDELLADRHREVLAGGVRLDLALELLLLELQPAGHAAAVDGGEAVVDARDL